MNYTKTIKEMENIKPREQIVYYHGHLAKDIETAPFLSEQRIQLEKLRDAAWAMYEKGAASLVQRRVYQDFEYIIEGNRPPFERVIWRG